MASETTSRPQEVSRIRQWFSLWGAVCCWIGFSIADVILTWRECIFREQYPGVNGQPALLALNIALFLLLLAAALLAGFLSYRTWRRLHGPGSFINSESTGRQEYMAMVGVLITTTMGVGIIWLGIPLWIITLCVRTR